jgi:hypothetical protein
MYDKNIGLFFIILFIFLLTNSFIIIYFNQKFNNITLESLCKKDGNCVYSSKNGTLSLNNIDATNGFISNLTMTSQKSGSPGKIQFVNGELICKKISC